MTSSTVQLVVGPWIVHAAAALGMSLALLGGWDGSGWIVLCARRQGGHVGSTPQGHSEAEGIPSLCHLALRVAQLGPGTVYTHR